MERTFPWLKKLLKKIINWDWVLIAIQDNGKDKRIVASTSSELVYCDCDTYTNDDKCNQSGSGVPRAITFIFWYSPFRASIRHFCSKLLIRSQFTQVGRIHFQITVDVYTYLQRSCDLNSQSSRQFGTIRIEWLVYASSHDFMQTKEDNKEGK